MKFEDVRPGGKYRLTHPEWGSAEFVANEYLTWVYPSRSSGEGLGWSIEEVPPTLPPNHIAVEIPAGKSGDEFAKEVSSALQLSMILTHQFERNLS